MAYENALRAVIICHSQGQNRISHQFAGDAAPVIILIEKNGKILILRFRHPSFGVRQIPLRVVDLYAGLRAGARTLRVSPYPADDEGLWDACIRTQEELKELLAAWC